MVEGIEDAGDIKPIFVKSFKKKYLKPDMVKRFLRDSKKKRNKRFNDSITSEEEVEVAKVIVDRSRDSFLGRSDGCMMKFNARQTI
jgi:hypothetical protein